MPATYTATNADAAAVAQRTIDRLATVTGIAGLQNPVDINTTNGGQLVAIADSYLNCIGYQARDFAAFSANNTSSTSYADVPGSSYTFSAPVAKTYSVDCDFRAFFSSAGGFAQFRIVFAGTNGPDEIFGHIATNVTMPGHMMFAAACSAGSNTVKLQWKVDTGTTTVNIDGNGHRHWMVRG